jgi:hypothetical protein
LAAAKEHDRARAAAKDAAYAQAQPTPHSDGRRTSGADQLRRKSIEVRAGGRLEPEPDEMDESEAVVEDDERQADDALRTGLETAIQAQEDAIDGIVLYSEGEGSDGEEAAKEAAATAAASAIREQAATTFKAEKRRLHEAHRDARKAVDEWKETLGYAKERDRQNRQRGRLTRAILEVQTDALNRRNDEVVSDEDLYNDTVAISWMPLLFDAMGAPGADPDVKRMALEAADKANINQIYSAGAIKQQWDAFVESDRYCGSGTIRESLLEARSGNL